MTGSDNEIRNYPMCGAKTRAKGTCKQPAMSNGRCYLHGGKSKSGPEHGRYKHGYFTREMIETRREVRELLRNFKSLAKMGYRQSS